MECLVKNTTNKGEGACWDIEGLKNIKKVCTANKLAYHLERARLWNAIVAKNEKPEEYGEIFDTISVCLSKSIGCSVGSVLVG